MYITHNFILYVSYTISINPLSKIEIKYLSSIRCAATELNYIEVRRSVKYKYIRVVTMSK